MRLRSFKIIMLTSTALLFSAFSCEEKDEVNCPVIQAKFLSLVAEIVTIQSDFTEPDFSDGLDQAECTSYSGWITGWSGKINELIALAKKGKSCDFVKDFIKDQGYTEDQVDQYIGDREDEIKSLKADLDSYCK